MATRLILSELSRRYRAATGDAANIEAMGGVDAAKRVREGAACDLVVLAADVLAKLEAEGRLRAGSVVPFVRSGMAIAVRAGAPHPDLSSAAAVRAAVMAAGGVGYSTGPSGDHLLKLCDDWGVPADRLVKAPPGVPVGSLVASGQADIGFQQLSELIHAEGVDVVGPLPPPIQAITVFAAGVASTSTQPERAAAFAAYLASPETAEVKRAEGMEPA